MYIITVDDKTKIMEKTDLAAMQEAVGGYIEIISTNDGRLMLLDEEGKLKGKAINNEAMKLAKGMLFYGDYIVGDVIIAEKDEIK